MRACFLTLLSLLLLLAACNLPSRQATPSPDAIATEVAAQLTRMPPATQAPLPSETAVIDTPVSPTATEAAQISATPQPSATANPSDPRLSLGEPTWREPFDSGKAFGLGDQPYDDDQTRIQVDNGALVLTSKNAAGFHGWRTGGPVSADRAYVEGTFQVGECAGGDLYGLVFRSPDYVDGYWFTARCDGRYAFGYWADNGYTNVLDGQDTKNAVLTGSNQVNRLGVLADGDRFALYANGVLLQEITDTTFEEGGRSGAVIGGVNTAGFTVRVDEIAYWTLP